MAVNLLTSLGKPSDTNFHVSPSPSQQISLAIKIVKSGATDPTRNGGRSNLSNRRPQLTIEVPPHKIEGLPVKEPVIPPVIRGIFSKALKLGGAVPQNQYVPREIDLLALEAHKQNSENFPINNSQIKPPIVSHLKPLNQISFHNAAHCSPVHSRLATTRMSGIFINLLAQVKLAIESSNQTLLEISLEAIKLIYPAGESTLYIRYYLQLFGPNIKRRNIEPIAKDSFLNAKGEKEKNAKLTALQLMQQGAAHGRHLIYQTRFTLDWIVNQLLTPLKLAAQNKEGRKIECWMAMLGAVDPKIKYELYVLLTNSCPFQKITFSMTHWNPLNGPLKRNQPLPPSLVGKSQGHKNRIISQNVVHLVQHSSSGSRQGLKKQTACEIVGGRTLKQHGSALTGQGNPKLLRTFNSLPPTIVCNPNLENSLGQAPYKDPDLVQIAPINRGTSLSSRHPILASEQRSREIFSSSVYKPDAPLTILDLVQIWRDEVMQGEDGFLQILWGSLERLKKFVSGKHEQEEGLTLFKLLSDIEKIDKKTYDCLCHLLAKIMQPNIQTKDPRVCIPFGYASFINSANNQDSKIKAIIFLQQPIEYQLRSGSSFFRKSFDESKQEAEWQDPEEPGMLITKLTTRTHRRNSSANSTSSADSTTSMESISSTDDEMLTRIEILKNSQRKEGSILRKEISGTDLKQVIIALELIKMTEPEREASYLKFINDANLAFANYFRELWTLYIEPYLAPQQRLQRKNLLIEEVIDLLRQNDPST